jgi:hypothetical protein
MTPPVSITSPPVWIAIDIAKGQHQVLIEWAERQRTVLRVPNNRPEIDRLIARLQEAGRRCVIAFEPTGDYHRPIAYWLGQAGFQLHQVSSLAVARTREALFNSWDKNDPKDAQVILHLLKTGATQRFVDPMAHGYVDLQELANTYQQVSLRKVRVYHNSGNSLWIGTCLSASLIASSQVPDTCISAVTLPRCMCSFGWPRSRAPADAVE